TGCPSLTAWAVRRSLLRTNYADRGRTEEGAHGPQGDSGIAVAACRLSGGAVRGRADRAVRDARVIPGDGSPRARTRPSWWSAATSHASAVAARSRPPAGASRIDPAGKTVMPALISTHVQRSAPVQ